ncbi:MAG: nickel-dependent hydrogenase large subunit [Paludibacterium sp.]|uniref:hydrogenase large subunit n=1 Tax=Paludibacterium sp. TaxID=1917523 RepID=UPI0025D60BF2|nr:nickel-dependent hydrogenase large subunit [Paludibacterium sp.]MBV8045694.1 nickel-dependent hydrogenase large subunit [Paludibacterium sp.]MBV8646103.1 nickel-dependent hydrogenase large subunit [Paludibacterium sp.]
MSNFTIPVGPLHVALEEPMYFRLDVQGETIAHVDIHAGHVHRGIEYLVTKRNVFQNVVLTERVCSLCSNSHPQAYAMAIERIAGIVVPPRAQYLRAVADEVKRVASHLFNVAILAHLVGFDALFMHVMEVRERMQDVKESVFGNRMDIGANAIGGVRYDIDAQGIGYLNQQLDAIDAEVVEIIDLYRTNGSILGRTRGIGVLPHADAVDCGVVGPVARAAGIDYDLRVKAPYTAYDRLDVTVHTLPDGDVWSRAMIRLYEARTAIGLIRQCLRDLPDGPTIDSRERPSIPAGEAIARCEAPRGELIYYVRMGDSPKPERVKWRVPSFMNWDALRIMLKEAKIADIAIIVNSIDPCISCTER